MGVPGEYLRPQGSLQCRGVGRGRRLTPLSGYQSIQCYKNYDDDWSTVINDDDVQLMMMMMMMATMVVVMRRQRSDADDVNDDDLTTKTCRYDVT